MQIEHRIQIATQPEVIFRLYEDVAHWHTWDSDTKQSVLDGPLRVGAKGRLTPTKGMAVPMRLLRLLDGNTAQDTAMMSSLMLKRARGVMARRRSKVNLSSEHTDCIADVLAQFLVSGYEQVARTFLTMKHI